MPIPNRRAAAVIDLMAQHGWTLATCESLTGGGLGEAITQIPGASAVYRGGLITYASDLKVTLAGVQPSWIEQHGVVNESTAKQMADGVRRVCGADWGIATTGVAGPQMQDGEAVGTVWIGLASPHSSTRAERCKFDGDREAIREATIARALEILCSVLGEK